MSARLTMVVVWALAGCNTSGSAGDDGPNPDAPPACASLSGSWVISGACGADLCTITQAGCAITAVSCTSGARSSSGSISGSRFSYTGTSGGGVPATCDGTAAGATIGGSCTLAGTTCSFSGSRS